MLESCQVLVTGNVHFVLLKRSQCALLLSVARRAAGATGRAGWGERDLHKAAIAGITELQKSSGDNSSLLMILWCFISSFCSTRWCWCVLYTKRDTLAQAGQQSSCTPDFLCTGWRSGQLHHLQNPGCSDRRVGLSFGTSASSSASCFQRGRMKHEFLLFNELLLDILRNGR